MFAIVSDLWGDQTFLQWISMLGLLYQKYDCLLFTEFFFKMCIESVTEKIGTQKESLYFLYCWQTVSIVDKQNDPILKSWGKGVWNFQLDACLYVSL